MPTAWNIVGLAGIGVVFAAVLCLGGRFVADPFLRLLARASANRRRVSFWLLAVFAVGMIQYGATKNASGTVRFPYTDVEQRYLYDTGSYVTNDLVHLSFARSPIVPATAPFFGAARPVGNTNDEDWVVFMVTDFNHVTSPTNIPYAGAQTNNFQFFTTYTPGPTVHTNGVAIVLWQTNYGGETNKFVTYRTGIYQNAFRLAPNFNITNGPAVSATVTLTQTPPVTAAESENE